MVQCRCVFVSATFHVLNIIGQCFRSQCLTIDNRIAAVGNGKIPGIIRLKAKVDRTESSLPSAVQKLTFLLLDCYARISVGSKLSNVDIASRVEVASLMECEEHCSQSERVCVSFMFGVGVKGNGTCALSARQPDLKNLEIDPDYDVYVKNQQTSPWCNVVHSYGRFPIRNIGNSTVEPDKRLNTKDSITFVDDSSFLKSIKPESSPLLRTISIPRGKGGKPNQGVANVYDLFVDHDGRFPSGDDDRRVLDILANKNQKKASGNTFEKLLLFSSYRFHASTKMFLKTRWWWWWWWWWSSVVFWLLSLPVIQSSTLTLKETDKNEFTLVTCHRKMHSGKKTMELLIDRVVDCQNVRDCHHACEHEKTFDCRGFNYRHETNGLKGTCELTATPYFRMKPDRDFLIDSRYDYYERDQNCFPFVRSDGSFAGKNRPNLPWSRTEQENANSDIFRQPSVSMSFPYYQTIYPTSHEFTRDFLDKHEPRPNNHEQFSHKTLRDFPFHQNPPSNWYGNGMRSESNLIHDANSFHDPPRIDFNNGLSNVRSSVSPAHRIDVQSLQRDFFYPRGNEHSSDQLYSYGSAFGYDANYVPSSKEQSFGGREVTSTRPRCFIKYATGSKLGRNVLRKSCLARDPKQCEQLCIVETAFACGSFAYRHNLQTTNPTDNCLFSDLSYKDFDSYTDLEPDRDYDVYITAQDPKVCNSKETTDRLPSGEEECFSRVRSGFGIPMDITRKSTFAQNLGECQFACTKAQEFLCKTLVYVYGTIKYSYQERDRHQHADSNCFLSDWPSGEIDPVNMLDMDGAELYERSSFSYGCGTYPLITSISALSAWYGKESDSALSDEPCYAQYHRPCKLMPHAIVSSMRAPTKSECRQKCSSMRNTGTVPCMSFNYMITATDSARDNCWFSDIPVQDLRPNLDYTHDGSHFLYTWKDLEPFCGLSPSPLYETNAAPVSKEHGRSSFPSTFDRVLHPEILFDDKSHGTGSIFAATSRTRDKFQPKIYGHGYEERESDHETDSIFDKPFGRFEHELDFHVHSRTLSTFQRYTVNGHPCRNGTFCQRNEIVGFWSCEIDDDTEHAAWDYCCEPEHRCGFSQGYHYPWCYVGSSYDQWRPCSETYYPYYLSKDRSFYQQSLANSARHWPIIYQHETLPSGCTLGNITERRNLRL
nr:uncharacterized protein LOC116433566 isoform X3 [Nomia melanderi]XP_031847638.1 uncharacterized protein LOC116433566 isoform X3 [Nomia melanderi]